MIRRAHIRLFSILAALLTAPTAACQDGGAAGVQVREALVSAPGLKVAITGIGELDHARVQAIAALLESKGEDVGAAMVRLKQGDATGDALEIEMWGSGLPRSQDIEGLLKAGFPELASATVQVSELAPGSGPTPPAIEVDDDLSAEEAKAQILEQLGGDGVVDVKVEDGEDGRRIEVRVEKHVEE